MDLYIPRKCSATNRLITSKDHASVQINIGHLDEFVVNSFYELEATYADHYINVLGRKAWHIGPVSLCNKAIEDKVEKKCGQLHLCTIKEDYHGTRNVRAAIHLGCEETIKNNEEEADDWLLEGFEKRMEEFNLRKRVCRCAYGQLVGASEAVLNEKLVTEVLNIEVAIGVQQWVRMFEDFVKKEAIEKAVTQIM
ncbi:hypothetical protein DITRI_Ditri12bG0022300 [Diplodiscus trichospermus]